MSRILRAAIGLMVAAGATVALLPATGGSATAATAAAPVGYPTPAAVGFQHLGLVYDNPQRTADDWAAWVAQHSNGAPVNGRWLFDSFLTLDLTAPSGTGTDTGVTTAADWTALLNRWFGTAPGGGTIGAIDAAVTRVAAARTTAGTVMGQPPTRRKVVVTIPWAADTQANFGVVDGRAADLRVPAERARVSAWFIDRIKQRFTAAGYRNLDLWGVYLMREDIVPGDEAWVTTTAATAHQRGLKIAWIPYYRAPGWDRWRTFGLDVAIMQPSYGFTSPVDGGQVDASRLTTTAELAKAAGLGVEIEARSSGASPYEAAMFQQYLSEGARLGYRNAATAYFLGWSRRPISSDDGYTALADYIGGGTVRSVDPQPAWQWTGTPTRTATTSFATRDDLTAVRIELTTAAAPWRGTVTVSQLANGVWQAAGTTYAGAAPLAGTHQQVLVSLSAAAKVTGLRMVLTPAAGAPPVAVDRIVLDTVWPTGTAGGAVGAPYAVSTGAVPVGQYRDSTDTTSTYGRGLLTDGASSTTGWWNARPVGWWGTSPVRVVFDLGATRTIDRVVLSTHDAADSSVNWPMTPALHLSAGCPVLATAKRGSVEACVVTTLSGAAPVVTGANGVGGRSLDGTITFAAPAPVTARYATLVVQPTGWFLADEVRFYSGGVDVTASVRYRLLTTPSPQSTDPSSYADNGVRLTDGNIAPLMSGPAVTGWQAGAGFTTTVDLTRATSVRAATSWFVDAASWGVVRPTRVTVTTSTDGITWSSLGSVTSASRTWNASVAYTVTGTARPARYVRFAVSADAARPTAWHMMSEVEVSA